MLAQVYHVLVAGYYLYVSNWMVVNVVSHKSSNSTDPTITTLQRFSLRYLTNWTFTLQSIFFVSCIFHDILQAVSGNERLKRKLKNIHTYFFTVLAGPAAVVVSLVFWGLWFIDRNLIFPKALDDVLPPWINHSLHTTTTLFVIGEIIVSYHSFPSMKQAVPGITAFLGLYTVCLLITYFQSGIWLYPFLKDLDWNARISFFVGTYLLAIAVFGLNKFYNSIVWRDTNETVSKKKQKKRH